MPNGWYPVPGLDVVLLNRTEQRNPRLEWAQSHHRMWAMRIFGSPGRGPHAPLEITPSGSFDFEDIATSVSSLLRKGVDLASVLTVDFEARRGMACGAFVVYGFGPQGVSILHEQGLAAALAERRELTDEDVEELAKHRMVVTSGVLAEGLQPPMTERSYAFDFESFDRLVISSSPLHYDPHWPPASILDVPAVALAQGDGIDVLLALWRAPTTETSPSLSRGTSG